MAVGVGSTRDTRVSMKTLLAIITTWVETPTTNQRRKWLVKLLAKASTTSGLLALEDIINTKVFGHPL